LIALGAGEFAAPLALLAQQPTKIPRIGWLQLHAHPESRHAAFLQGLRELGYVEGRNLIIERRAAGGKEDRLPTLAAGHRRKIVADDWPGWGINDALRAVRSAPATPPLVPAGPGPV